MQNVITQCLKILALAGTSIKYNQWIFLPFNIKSSKFSKLANSQLFAPSIVNGKVNFDDLRNIVSKHVDECKKEYESIFGDKHNSYSMTLFSGIKCDKPKRYYLKSRLFQTLACLELVSICRDSHSKLSVFHNEYKCDYRCSANCLYMGDYDAKNNNSILLKKFYSAYWKQTGLLQVPHHGSENNYHNALYNIKYRICVISAGKNDKYGHPDKSTLLKIIRHKCLPLIVTEDPSSQLKFNYKL